MKNVEIGLFLKRGKHWKKKKKADVREGQCCFPENRPCFDLSLTCPNVLDLKSTFLLFLRLGLSTLAAYNCTYPTLTLKSRNNSWSSPEKCYYRQQKLEYLFVLTVFISCYCSEDNKIEKKKKKIKKTQNKTWKIKRTCTTTYYCICTAYRQRQSPACRVNVQRCNHKCTHAPMLIFTQLFYHLETTNQNKLWRFELPW